LPYEIAFYAEKSSTVIISEYAPDLILINQNMSTYGNEPPAIIDTSAITDAIASQTTTMAGIANSQSTNIAALAAAIAALPPAIADAIANNQMTILDPIKEAIGVVFSQPSSLATNNNRQRLEISNRGNTKLKIWTGQSAPPSGTTFLNADKNVVELIAATGTFGTPGYKSGGTWIADDEFSKGQYWLISDSANGQAVINQVVTT
jgi:hypothetical protein